MSNTPPDSDESHSSRPQYAVHMSSLLPFWAVVVAGLQYLVERWARRR